MAAAAGIALSRRRAARKRSLAATRTSPGATAGAAAAATPRGSLNPMRAASWRAADDAGGEDGDDSSGGSSPMRGSSSPGKAAAALGGGGIVAFAPRPSSRALAFKPVMPAVTAEPRALNGGADRGGSSVWVECMSQSRGLPYWRHRVTGETTWDQPPPDSGDDAGALTRAAESLALTPAHLVKADVLADYKARRSASSRRM